MQWGSHASGRYSHSGEGRGLVSLEADREAYGEFVDGAGAVCLAPCPLYPWLGEVDSPVQWATWSW
jgi:hypothetical protein